MMNERAVRTGLSTLALTLSALAAVAQLNPTVKVLSTPVSPVPPECIEGMAPQQRPRVDVAQIPEAPKQKAMKAPPSASLRGLLEETQAAASRGDRQSFRDALGRAKGMLETYATGGERNVATEVIGIYDDVDRIWSYQLDTPAGAFFDAGTVPAEIMKKYPGYESAIAGQVFADSRGHRFYPTVETREYLLRDAAKKLERLGVSAAAPSVRESRVVSREAVPAVKTTPMHTAEKTTARTRETRKTTPATTQKPVTHRAATHAKTAAKPATKPVVKPAEKPLVTETKSEKKPAETAGSMSAPKSVSKPAETPKAAESPKPTQTPKAAALPTVSPTPSTTALAPMTTPAPKSTTPATSPSPAVPTVATDTATTPSITAPVKSETAASSAPVETTSSAASTDTTGTAGKEQKQGRSVILPIILIVVGIGVLIVLFRASS